MIALQADPRLTVRAATVDDVAALIELESDARNAIAPQRGGARRLAEVAPHGDQWHHLLARHDAGVAVAEVDDVVLGWLSVRGPDALGVAVIDSVYVAEGARELGLGDDLVDWALQWARSHGATSIDSWALPGDRDTKNLFERNGLTARLITVSRSLSPVEQS